MFKDDLREISKKLSPSQRKEYILAKRFLPLLISGLILYYYFNQIDWSLLKHSLLKAHLALFIPSRLIPLFIYLLIDSYLLKVLFDWFHQPIRFREVVYPRAALYLLALINVQVSNGGMFLYLMRRADIKTEKLAGLVAFRFAWSVWSINFGLSIALLLTFLLKFEFHSPLAMELILLGVGIIWASLLLYLGLAYYYNHYRPETVHRPLWNAFIQARPRQYLEIAGFTLLLAGIGVINNYLCALSFGIKIPLHELVVLLPIVDLIANLPIAFAGLGTTTFAWQTFWSRYATPEAFLSFTIALPVTTYLSRALFALIAFPRAVKYLQEILNKKK